MNSYWICDTCGEKIHTPQEGVIEWYADTDEKDGKRRSKLRLVHVLSASPLRRINMKRKGCEFDLHPEQFKTEGTVENQPLGDFLGPDGLVHLLSLISEGEFPVVEVLRMIKRLHIPGYEMARDSFRQAALQGIIEPDAKGDHCNQSDITAVLKWMEERKR